MVLHINRRTVLLMTFVFLVLGNSSFLISINRNSIFMYTGYFILVCGIVKNLLQNAPIGYQLKVFCRFGVVLFLFCIGIIFQNLKIGTKWNLIASMVIIAVISILGEGYLKNLKELRGVSYGILIGLIMNIFLALWTETPLFSMAHEGSVWNIGFTGGLQHKNYFGVAILSSLSGISLYWKFIDKRKIDQLVMAIEVLLLVLSNSRTAIILYFLFVIFLNLDIIKKIKKSQRTVFRILILLAVILGGYILYTEYVILSQSYLYRVKGLLNYISVYGGDTFHMLFGNAEMAFRESGLDYNSNVRSIIGWDGTVELAALSILIKNGMLGFLGYAIIFNKYLKTMKKMKDMRHKCITYAIIFPFLLSSFVETYLVNLNVIYAAFAYITLSGFCSDTEIGRININSNSKKDD